MNKRNINRPGYKETQYGWIPSEWKSVKINQIFSDVNDFSHDQNEFPLYSLTINGGVVPKTDRYERSYLLKNKDDNKYKLVLYDDIVFNPMNLRFGSIALSTVKKPVIISAYYNVIRFHNNINPKYYIELFKTKEMLSIYNNIAIGSLIEKRRIHWSIFKKIEVPLPSLKEQNIIAEIISTWDRVIAQTEKLIELKGCLKVGLMQQILTGEKRFNEFIAENWKIYKLGTLFSERIDQGNSQLNLLSITASEGVVLRDKIERKDSSSKDKSKYLRILPGDIGYNTMRMWQGVSAVSKLEGIVSPAYTVCVPNEKILTDFAGYLFKLPQTINKFHRYSQGLVSDTLNLKFHNFVNIEVTIPDITEQMKIYSFFNIIDKDISLLKDILRMLSSQKKGIIQKILTGEIRVSIN